jgi:hypothetical protein
MFVKVNENSMRRNTSRTFIKSVALSGVSSLFIQEFDTYGEAMASNICQSGFWGSALTGDLCADLGIENDYCTDLSGFRVLSPESCVSKEVLTAILHAAGDTAGFMNHHGSSSEYLARLDTTFQLWDENNSSRTLGGLLFPKVDIDTLNDIAVIGFAISHLHNGAPLQVSKDDTAFPWRGAAILGDFSPDRVADRDAIHLRLKKAGVEPQGYYAYLNPPNMPNWRTWYWDDHYTKLSEIRGDYDPFDVFGKPSTVETPRINEGHSSY